MPSSESVAVVSSGRKQHRVIIVDDHSLVRQGLRTVLSEEPDIELVAEGQSAAEAVTLVEEFLPDVILIDLTLPDGNGLEVIRHLKKISPNTGVIVITIHDNELFMIEALESGASGYLLKDSSHQLISLAIRTCRAGGCLVERRLMERLLRALPSLQRSLTEDGQSQLQNRLGDRELAVLRLICRGRGNREIGEQLHLAESTVKKYVQSLKTKLNVQDRAEAAVLAVRLGLVE